MIQIIDMIKNTEEIQKILDPLTLPYDSRNRLHTRTFVNGRVLTYSYNDYNQVTNIVDTAGPSVFNVYDDVNRLHERTVTDGTTNQTTTYEWDDRNRLTAVIDPLNRRTEIEYDMISVGCTIVDKPVRITDPAGRVTEHFYDNMLRLVRTVDPKGGVVRFEYGLRGDRIAITDSEGNRTRYRHDGNRRLIRRERPTVRTSNGKQIATTEITNYHYNQNNQITRKEVELPTLQNGTYKGYLVTEYQYNELNQLSGRKQFKEGFGGEVLETYEDSNFTYHRQLDATLSLTANNEVVNLGFTYETTPPFAPTGYTVAAAQVGNPLNLIEGNFVVTPEVEAPIGTIAKDGTTLITRDYDPAGRLTNTNATFAGNILNTIIAHDSFGRKESVNHSNGLVGTYAHDLLNRVTGISWSDGAGENFSEGITYDTQTGNITGIDREFGSFTYGYDSTNQLVSTAYTGTTTLPDEIFNRNFDYDYVGNRTNDTANGETKSFRNIILENDKFKYYPDEDGLSRIIQKNSKTSNVVDLFKYRADGRLRTFKRYEGNLKTREVGYFYDAYGRRVAKELDINGSQFTQSFLHLVNNDKILLAQNGQGDQTLFIDGRGVDEHLGKVDSTSGFAFTTDHLGSVINGEVMAEKRVAGPFGERTSSTDLVTTISSAPVLYSWAGRVHEGESGLEDNRNRTYDSTIGLFNSPDRLGQAGSGPHLSLYAGNSPIMFFDPLGLAMCYANLDAAIHMGDSYEKLRESSAGRELLEIIEDPKGETYYLEYTRASYASGHSPFVLQGDSSSPGASIAAKDAYNTTIQVPFRPETASMSRLLAHELSHAVDTNADENTIVRRENQIMSPIDQLFRIDY